MPSYYKEYGISEKTSRNYSSTDAFFVVEGEQLALRPVKHEKKPMRYQE